MTEKVNEPPIFRKKEKGKRKKDKKQKQKNGNEKEERKSKNKKGKRKKEERGERKKEKGRKKDTMYGLWTPCTGENFQNVRVLGFYHANIAN